MLNGASIRKHGYTIVELLVTILIVTILAATVGMFFVKLLRIQEQDREDGYVREKLADICAEYADALSIGSCICRSTNAVNPALVVSYRQETGGVSLETGIVTRVAYFASCLNATNKTLDAGIYSKTRNELEQRLARVAHGDAELIAQAGNLVSCTITPIEMTSSSGGQTATVNQTDVNAFAGKFQTVLEVVDTPLAYLEICAAYRIKDDDGNLVEKRVSSGRIVRLWNHQ